MEEEPGSSSFHLITTRFWRNQAMPTLYSIYKITNIVNGKFYIGFTKNLQERWIKHLKCSNGKSTYLIHKSIYKHGKEKFLLTTIYQSWDGDHCLNTMEPYFIRKFNSHVSEGGYNMTWGGTGGHTRGMTGKTHTKETKRKISESRKGIPHPRGMLGKKHSEQSKHKMRLNNIGGKSCNAKSWKIIDPFGVETVTKDLTGYCINQNINKRSLKTAFNKSKEYRGYKLFRNV